MGVGYKNISSSRGEYTLTYSDMRGVDMSSGNARTRTRYAYLENMYKDYDGDGSGMTESIPGFRKIAELGGRVNSIFSHIGDDGREYAVVHAGTSLFRFAVEERDSLDTLSAIAEVKNVRSHAFTSGSDLYVLDGEKITRISGNGSVGRVEFNDVSPYVPTTYMNGSEYEQRNLLTDRFREVYTVTTADEHYYGTPTLSYKIISPLERTAAVIGIESETETKIYVPSYININGVDYSVITVADSAFIKNTVIEEVYLSPKVTAVGQLAFCGCVSLKKVIASDFLERIENEAFTGCTALEKLHIGSGLTYIGVNSFKNSVSLTDVSYTLNADSFREISGYEELIYKNITYEKRMDSVRISVPIFSPAVKVRSVKISGITCEFYAESENGIMKSIVIDSDNKGTLSGKAVEIIGEMDPMNVTKNSAGEDFIVVNGASISGQEAILGCTVAESFDGRIFLSGNPKLPNTVFYSSKNLSGRNDPTYFGVLNYFNDGTGGFKVISMLTSGDSLAVFKEGDDGGGSIFYHTPKGTGINILPKIYPVSYTHNGISGLGESISFFDDPVFVSSLGISALDKKDLSLERSVVTRSHNVNPKLLSEELSRATLAQWQGYLAVCTGEHIYLADSRATFTSERGVKEYEWYFLTGIGTYKEDMTVYRFASYAHAGLEVYEKPDEPFSMGTIFRKVDSETGTLVYYTMRGGKYYEITPSEERNEGVFSPASCIYSFDCGKLLFFGTESGDICVFNNDKRGVPPYYLTEMADFDPEEYAKMYSRRIHPYFYSFAYHAPRYSVRTVRDDCGIPHLSKNTVKNSLTVKLKSFSYGSIICEVGTDRSGYREIASIPDTGLNFEEIDFSALSFANADYVTLPVSEKEKGWVEKEINLYTDEYMSPFGICNLAYRFEIKGKIKKI